jgi:hypothetical protein
MRNLYVFLFIVFANSFSSAQEAQKLLETREACSILSDLFEGHPSKSEIQEYIDPLLKIYNSPVTEEYRLRAGSVLIYLRKEFGVSEINQLQYMKRHIPSKSDFIFPDAAAISVSAYVRDPAINKGSKPPPKPEVKPNVSTDNPRALFLLNSGKGSEKSGHPKVALGYYRELVEKFPDTVAAKTARERIKALGVQSKKP